METKKNGFLVMAIILVSIVLLSNASSVSAVGVGDYIMVKMDVKVGGEETRVGKSYWAGNIGTFNITASSYAPGGTTYECALLLSEEDNLACDDDYVVWVENSVILGEGTSLSNDAAGKWASCCGGASTACAKNSSFICGDRCTWIEGGSSGAREIFQLNYGFVGSDQCGGFTCPLYPPPTGGNVTYNFPQELLCEGSWQLCNNPVATCVAFGSRNYVCDNGDWTACVGATPDCVGGVCVAAATCDTDPTVEIIPSSIITTAGASENYTVEITNNDDNSCAAASRTFDLTVAEPGWQVGTGLSTGSVIASKKNADGTTNPIVLVSAYNLESPLGTADGFYGFTVMANANPADGSGAGNGPGIYNILDTICITHGMAWNNDPYTEGDTVEIYGQSLGADTFGACIELYDDSNNLVDQQQIPYAAGGNMNSASGDSTGKAGTWTGKLYINDDPICSGTGTVCTATIVVAGGGGGGGCTIIWSGWGSCTGNLGTQTRTDTNCGTGGTQSQFCCDVDSGNTIPANHCIASVPICDTSVPPGVCVECLVTPDCNPGYVCESNVCIPCTGEGGAATAAHLCCEGLNWIDGICTSACDPNAWFFCNPLRGDIETLAEGGERIIGYILGLIGSVFLLLIVISGAMYMTSAGSEEKIASSKKILTAAVIGLAIALLAYSLLLVIMGVLGM